MKLDQIFLHPRFMTKGVTTAFYDLYEEGYFSLMTLSNNSEYRRTSWLLRAKLAPQAD